ncbi:MAG: ABC transporter permease [Lentisphaeria bacterium]|nr:ABC transporter permease [Lentisphaeria bacterium]
MLRYFIRRTAYSVLIITGIVLLTFALFNLASGDPAAAVLGKNPRPAEVESLRRELGADLPILWGKRCRTECYSSLIPGGTPGSGMIRNGDQWTASPLFPADFPVEMTLQNGVAGENLIAAGAGQYRVKDPAKPVTFSGTAPEVHFYRLQENPWNSQFLRALGEIIRIDGEAPYVHCFNFGRTLTTREPIRAILWRGVWPSLGLMIPIFLGELVLGIALALIATAFKDRWPDRVLVLLSVGGMSVSYLVLILFAQWFFGYYCNWFPVWGWGSLRHLLLPVMVGIASGLGSGVRFYRTVFADELRREYLRTAAAKGCSPLRVYGRHLLANAAIPILTRASAVLPFLFTGSLLLETFFGIPGLGFAGVDALNNSDLQLLKALVIVSAMLFVFLNLLTDLAYAWVDPRIRLE